MASAKRKEGTQQGTQHFKDIDFYVSSGIKPFQTLHFKRKSKTNSRRIIYDSFWMGLERYAIDADLKLYGGVNN